MKACNFGRFHRCPVTAYLTGTQFSGTKEVNGSQVSVAGVDNGQAIAIHPSGHQFLILSYRCWVTFCDPVFQQPAMKQVHVERGYFVGNETKGNNMGARLYH